MKKKPKAAEIEETKVLFPEEEVGPYVLRPWTLTQFGQLLGVLMSLMDNFIALGLNFDNAEDFLEGQTQKLLPLLTPLFPEIIAVTLRLPPAEVAEIEVGLQMALGLRILLNEQNQRQIKNFYAGFLGGKKGPAPLSTH